MSPLFYGHSGIRYLVLLGGVMTLSYAIFGLVTRRDFDRTMGRLASAFAGLLHLQILLGVALLFMGRTGAPLSGHVMTMVFAAAAAQIVPSVMKRRPREERTYAPFVVGTAVALALIAVGIVVLGRPIVG